MMNYQQLNKKIREARLRAGLSQQQLAEAVGVSDKTISAYEVGRVDPSLEALEKVGKATKHPIGYFVGDIQSNVEARLERVVEELVELRRLLSEKKTSSDSSDEIE